MSKLGSLDGSKMRIVSVKTSIPNLEIPSPAYDDGGPFYEVRDGVLYVREMEFIIHPSGYYKSKWKPVVSEEHALAVIIYDWPMMNERERHLIE